MFRCLLISLVLAATLTVVLANFHQCPYNPCQGKIHTMCKFPYSKPSRMCGRIKHINLSNKDRREILDLHNQLRRRVASGKEIRGIRGPQPAGFIPPLKWDAELEKVAQRWANQCNYGHDECRDIGRFYVGQNVAWQGHTNPKHIFTFTNIINHWYDEVKIFNARELRGYVHRPEIGHYTQMVWADTLYIGCGAILYEGQNWNSKIYFVCNYGPTGNIPGQSVYRLKPDRFNQSGRRNLQRPVSRPSPPFNYKPITRQRPVCGPNASYNPNCQPMNLRSTSRSAVSGNDYYNNMYKNLMSYLPAIKENSFAMIFIKF